MDLALSVPLPALGHEILNRTSLAVPPTYETPARGASVLMASHRLPRVFVAETPARHVRIDIPRIVHGARGLHRPDNGAVVWKVCGVEISLTGSSGCGHVDCDADIIS